MKDYVNTPKPNSSKPTQALAMLLFVICLVAAIVSLYVIYISITNGATVPQLLTGWVATAISFSAGFYIIKNDL
jgi:hypothetical protein